MANWTNTINWQENRYRGEIVKDIEDIIRSACGINRGQAFKHKIPLQQLINYKAEANNENSYGWKQKTEADLMNEKFKYFAKAIVEITTHLKMKYPFIDLTGIGLNWTADEIIDAFMELYLAIPVRTLEDRKNSSYNKKEQQND